jgi:pimeloyl-ACP methyl ester carboxylesterase
MLIDLQEQLNPDGGELRPVYAVGYDWRGGNRDSARRLIRRVGEILGRHPLAKQVVIVSHSMGGLVTRSALAQGLEPQVAGVVHTVMPADGAVVAYRRFLTGARDEYRDGEVAFRGILGNSRLNYSLMQSVLRGPTELLPTNSYPDPFVRLPGDINNKFFQDIYAEYERTTPPGILYREGESLGVIDKITATDVTNLQNRFREARAFSASIAGRVHPRTFLLFGKGLENDVEFDFTRGMPTADGSKMQAMVIRKADGDGTVPLASANFSAATGALGRATFKVEHAECFRDAEFRRAVVARVRQIPKP